MQTKLKICGIQRIKDIECLNEYKPDYAGFIFAKSKRQVCPKNAFEMINKLNGIKSVGVFVNEDADKVIEISNNVNLDVIQLHGDETNEYIKYIKSKIKIEVWKALRVQNTIDCIKEYNADKFLLDTYTPNQYGGSGSCFNWSLLEGIDKSNIILAGGINKDNILEAINYVNPYMIDVNSGVETNGFKDYNKIRELFAVLNRQSK